MRIVRREEHAPMAWKNGLGMTTELAISPEGSTVSSGAFDWRLSIADVGGDGPFSAFPGYDRHIMLLSGEGMILTGGEGRRLELTEPLQFHRFPGEWSLMGHLVDGPVRDFNVMVRRGVYRSEVSAETLSEARAVGASILHVLQGVATAGGHLLEEGATAVPGAGGSVKVTPLSEPVRLVLVRLSPVD